MNLGNKANRTVISAKGLLFLQAEQLQLAYTAFAHHIEFIEGSDESEFTINYPVGYGADRTAVAGSNTYSKSNLIERYRFLQYTQLGLNGILQLTTTIEAMFGDVLRLVVMKHPHKLGAKRSIPAQAVLTSSSIEEVHLKATYSF